MNLSQELEMRGFVNQYSAATLAEILDGEKRVVYHGIDPTADSIHVGNFALFMLLRHLVQHGHTIILLIGGGTGMIGDPKPDVERPLTPKEVVAERVEKIRVQAERLLGTTDVVFVNNDDWLSSLNLITFLRDIGKHFTVNELIKKDAIATRLTSESGISYTEFAYPLLQAYDYYKLNQTHGCNLQVGGSDQWGNIVSGVDLIRKKTKQTVYALTTPLIIDKSTGKKFGKSEGNAVWLDGEKTSPYQFYQFWLNVSDDGVLDYLKLFTFLSLPDIEEIRHNFESNPGARTAQKALAEAVTTLVHGEEISHTVANASDILFGDRELVTLTPAEKSIILENAPKVVVTNQTPVVAVLVSAQLATSNREARTFIESGAVSLNGQKIVSVEAVVSEEQLVSGIAVLKRGKKNLCVVTM